MAEVTLEPREAFSAQVRRAPLGVAMIAASFAIVGVGSLIGGLYLLLGPPSASVWAGASALLVAPAALYLAARLLALARWTWLSLIVLTALLLISSVVRLLGAPPGTFTPIVEIAVELLALSYLRRPTVRAAFGRSAAQ